MKALPPVTTIGLDIAKPADLGMSWGRVTAKRTLQSRRYMLCASGQDPTSAGLLSFQLVARS